LRRSAIRRSARTRTGSPADSTAGELHVDFAVTQKFSVAVGGNNVLDEYPDLLSSDINFFGNLPYNVLQPISFNGAFFYLRRTYTF
jgi:iron complex outermembrane receptor protein